MSEATPSNAARDLRECPDCGGHGWIMVPDKKGNPTQVQCQRCNGNGYMPVPGRTDNPTAASLGGDDSNSRVAALFVDPKGVYANLADVEVWDEARDARLYAGPWPVVAHPPCARWSNLAHIHKHRWPIGADDGCFEAALAAVRRWGGVLEHPAGSLAWAEYELPYPGRYGWASSLDDAGLVTEVDQGSYGHPARKRTWLYAVGVEPCPLDWRPARGYPVENMHTATGEAARTPIAFRDVLLNMARIVRAAELCA